MDVRLPRLGEGADSGVISTLFVKLGDTLKKDQPILELESEKAVASIPSPSAGTVTKIFVKEGDEIKVGALIVSLAESGNGESPVVQPASAAPPVIDARVGDEEEAAIDVAPPPAPGPVAPLSADFPVAHPAGVPPPASPSIRKIARELGLDLHRVRGSEHGGRIVMADLRAYAQKIQEVALSARAGAPAAGQGLAARPAPVSVDFSKWGPVSVKKMSQLRKAISAKMSESWAAVPRVTQFDEADITDLMALRKKHAGAYEQKGGHLTLTTFALKAVVAMLKKYPDFNASIDEGAGTVVLKQYYHIGIAVDTEQGLIVPVLRDADKKSMLELAVGVNELAERTRERKVSLDEMQGGTFTISNQGGIGGGHFTPVVNTPEVAILGIGRGVVKPVVKDGKIVPRTMLPITLSYDHRVVDGASAARFVTDLVKLLEGFKESDVAL
jgi:pyruvate dehydrogenase E2 component (dihydrolipoamide acetyltransferase)